MRREAAGLDRLGLGEDLPQDDAELLGDARALGDGKGDAGLGEPLTVDLDLAPRALRVAIIARRIGIGAGRHDDRGRRLGGGAGRRRGQRRSGGGRGPLRRPQALRRALYETA